MPIVWILFALILTEIAVFVAVGGWIGIVPVLALVVLGALAGIAVLRGRLARLPELIRAGADPARLVAAGMMTAAGAVLLMLPGFVTDLAGLALLLPPVQRAAAARLTRGASVSRWHDVVIVEGEAVEVPPESDRDGDGATPRGPGAAAARLPPAARRGH